MLLNLEWWTKLLIHRVTFIPAHLTVLSKYAYYIQWHLSLWFSKCCTMIVTMFFLPGTIWIFNSFEWHICFFIFVFLLITYLLLYLWCNLLSSFLDNKNWESYGIISWFHTFLFETRTMEHNCILKLNELQYHCHVSSAAST